MSFISLEMLWVLWIIPIIILAYVLAQKQRRKYTIRYSSLLLVKKAAEKRFNFRRHIPPILFTIGLVILVTALARPIAKVIIPTMKGTVILAIDVSGSMEAEDLKPTRLEAAKSAARTFVQNQPGNIDIGVVSFSCDASIVQPPTRDRQAANDSINRLTIQGGTAIGSAIQTSLDAIFGQPDARPDAISSDKSGARESSVTPSPVPRGTYAPGVIVLLTDGVSNDGPNPLEVVWKAVDQGVRIFTIGIGSPEGAAMSYRGTRVRLDLDEDMLKRVAEKTDGLYFNATNEINLHKIYGNLSTKLVLEPIQTELTAGFTGLAMVFLISAGILSLLWFNRLA
jgi:Ca-activated chloride channel homolog